MFREILGGLAAGLTLTLGACGGGPQDSSSLMTRSTGGAGGASGSTTAGGAGGAPGNVAGAGARGGAATSGTGAIDGGDTVGDSGSADTGGTGGRAMDDGGIDASTAGGGGIGGDTAGDGGASGSLVVDAGIAGQSGSGARSDGAAGTSGESGIGGLDGGLDAEDGAAGCSSVEQQELVGTDALAGDFFGSSVSVSGDSVLVGAPHHLYPPGAAYVFVHASSGWSQQGAPLIPNDLDDSLCGAFVSLFGDFALVGAAQSAYVFARTDSQWKSEARLLPSDGFGSTVNGYRVALGQDTAVLGAPHSQVGSRQAQGAVYVFVRDGTTRTWSQQGLPLTASDGDSGDQLGSAVALSGETLLATAAKNQAGARSAVYVFVRNGTSWTQQGEPLVAPDGLAEDQFGGSLALSGDTAIIGAGAARVGSNADQGAFYVFVRKGETWTQQGSRVVLSDGQEGDSFASSVSLSGDLAVVGAQGRTVSTSANRGAAYVFARRGEAWAQQGAALVNPDGTALPYFGAAVSISGGNAVVGAPLENPGGNIQQGTALMFSVPTCMP